MANKLSNMNNMVLTRTKDNVILWTVEKINKQDEVRHSLTGLGRFILTPC